MKAEEWRKSCGEDDAILSSCIDDLAESETLVAVLKKAIAHSSTQCREMVKVLDDARGMAHRHYTEDDCQECGVLRESIDAVLNERSTP